MRKGKKQGGGGDPVVRLLGGGEPMQFRELLKALSVTRWDRSRFEEHLDLLVETGDIVKLPGRLYALPGSGTGVRGKLSVHPDGFGFVVPEEGGDDLFIPR